MKKDVLRIGNAQAFWGDRSTAARDLLAQEPDLDYLTLDYLAEVSMSILARERERDAALGYPRDFVEAVRRLADYWAAGGRCRLVANAGGLAPAACAAACRAALEERGCRSLTIGVVSGDECLELLRSAGPDDPRFANLDSGAALVAVRGRLLTANAYLGCRGIVAALAAGADIVITGRVADPSLVVGPCVHEFGWGDDDWDRLAGATVAGHLLECGTQVTGGISTDWLDLPDAAHVGFPIAEIDRHGECTITKSPRAGGAVTPATVKEQLVYEIGDPARYVSPDVCVSFLDLAVEAVGPDRVRVRGARGMPRPPTLKVSATHHDGFRAAGTLVIVGDRAAEKAARCGRIVLERLAAAGHRFRDTLVECLGTGASVPVEGIRRPVGEATETVLRIAVEAESRSAVEAFAREIMPLVTAGPQGTTGYAEGRPRVHEVVRYWPCLIDAGLVAPQVETLVTADTRAARGAPAAWPPEPVRPALPSGPRPAAALPAGRERAGTLLALAHGRSGDKGTSGNVGVLLRDPADLPWLVEWLTAERVARHFAPLGVTGVERHLMPNLDGANFILHGALARGIRTDAQGKALAEALLALPLRPGGIPQAADEAEAPWVDGLSIGQVLRATATRFPDRPAAVFPERGWRMTWGELDREVDRVAAALLSLGLERGDHFGVWATNVPEWLLLQFATARIGVVLVTVNPSYRPAELAFALTAADIKGLAVIDRFKTTDYLASLLEAVPDLSGCRGGVVSSAAFPRLREVVQLRGPTAPWARSWDDFLGLGAGIPPARLALAEAAVGCDEPVNIQFTSGTTGNPKGATLSHRNILVNAFYAGTSQRLSALDSICVPVPLYHCFGCVLGSLCGVVHGTAIVFPAEAFQAESVLAAIEAERCTALYGVPTMFIALLEHPDWPRRDVRSLRTGIMAGSPCPIELMKRVTGEMGAAEMTIGYGQTEASPLVTQTRFDDPLELRVGTVGRVIPGCEAKIVDPESGRTLPDGQAGEFCARGHGVMLGYYRQPDLTARAIDAEGWLHTGDLALRDASGCYRITGRLKDLVIRGGENVFPREVEEVLYAHPAVRDVQVIGVPDRKFGEQVMAWVCLREGRTASAEELKQFCRERLAYFKVPHYWKFVDAFPTTVTGKIQKFRMREISIVELGLEDVARIETA
ncbi:MAG: acyclic terpene utilization AtuA family protein [Planctomycetaceae bacterium]